MDNKNRALFLVNTRGRDRQNTVYRINVDELAYEFAEIPNTINLFLFIASRNPGLSIPENQEEK